MRLVVMLLVVLALVCCTPRATRPVKATPAPVKAPPPAYGHKVV